MKDIRSYINEGFFANVTGIDAKEWKEWFANVPVYFEQYLTKYDNKKIGKDEKRFVITFYNNYKRDNDKRNVYLDLSPYMEGLTKYDAKNIVIEFSTGLYSGSNSIQTKINNKEKYDKYIESDSVCKYDKHIRIYIYTLPGDNPKYGQQIINGNDVNKMTNTRYDSRLSYAGNHKKRESSKKLLLSLTQYCDDFPHFTSSWTELYNGLK